MSVKLIYKDFAVGAAEDAAVSATGQANFSTITLLPFGSDNPKMYATLERNRWMLNGAYSVFDGGPVSFWSDALSDNEGVFAEPPTLTVDFDENYTSVGITFLFDIVDFARELTVTWYRDGEVLDEKTFYPNSSAYLCENTVEAYDKVAVTFAKTSLPHRRLKLDAIQFGIMRTFRRNELRNVNVIQEIDPISRELAVNTLDWTLDSKEAVEYIFQLKQPVEAYDGQTLIGTYYIDDSSRRSQRIYDISCIDAIGVLDEEMFPDAVYADKPAVDLATEILGGHFALQMDTALQGKTVSGALVGLTRRQALQQLCFAIGAVADTSGTDAVKVFALPTVSSVQIGADRTRTGDSVTTDAIVTAIKLTAHSYSTEGSGETVTVNGVEYYHTTAVTTITNPSVTATDKQNVIEIADATLISPGNVEEIAQRVYDFYTRRKHHNFKFRLDGETVGDYVDTVTNWGETISGNIARMSIVLSGIAVADSEVV